MIAATIFEADVEKRKRCEYVPRLVFLISNRVSGEALTKTESRLKGIGIGLSDHGCPGVCRRTGWATVLTQMGHKNVETAFKSGQFLSGLRLHE